MNLLIIFTTFIRNKQENNMESDNVNEEPTTIFLTHKEFQKYLLGRKGKRGMFYCNKCGELTSCGYNTSTVHLLCRDCNEDRLDFGL